MLEILEQYLRDEGLYNIILEHRRRLLFRLPIIALWLVFAWGPAIWLAANSRGVDGLVVAIVMPFPLFVVILLLLAVSNVIRKFRTGKRLTNEDAGIFVGLSLILILPLLTAIALGVYLSSWLSAFVYSGVYALGYSVVLFMQMQAYRIHLLLESIRSVFRALGRSLTLLLVLIPMLLIVVVLSVFSQELWQALATLPIARLIGSVVCLLAPALVFVMASLNRETRSIIGAFPDKNQIVERAENTHYIKDRLDKGLISQEEWTKLKKQIEWRSEEWLSKNLTQPIFAKTKRWLALLLMLTSLTLVVAFTSYFYVFFNVTLDPSLVELWVSPELVSVSWAMAKVSFVLAVFIAVMATVYALTDETIKNIFTEWLSDKSSSWLALSALYLCANSPHYEVWEYLVRDKKQGRVNVFIVVPKGLSDADVQEACEHMASTLNEYRNVIITAFEEKPGRPIYKLGMPGNRWRLIHNKPENIRSFEPIPLDLDELRYQHFLGQDSFNHDQEIPEEWFGNTPHGKEFAKAVWTDDKEHEWVLHPYVFQNGAYAGVEIGMMKRMAESSLYRKYIHDLLQSAREKIPEAESISIDLAYRDTLESLARIFWSKEFTYVEYSDEILGEKRTESPSLWD